MRGWAGIGALADIFKLTLMVHWKANSVCDCDFNNVFVPDTCGLMTSMSDGPKFNLLERWVDHPATQNTECYNAGTGITEDEFWDAAKHRARTLKLRPEHSDTLEAFMDTVPESMIGLHVRRTDLTPKHISDPPLYAELDRTIAEEPDVSFLLCADNPKSITELCARYGDRIYHRTQHMSVLKKKKHRHTSQADAAIDVYSLARTKRILGTRCSSFSGYAAFLGGIPLKPV